MNLRRFCKHVFSSRQDTLGSWDLLFPLVYIPYISLFFVYTRVSLFSVSIFSLELAPLVIYIYPHPQIERGKEHKEKGGQGYGEIRRKSYRGKCTREKEKARGNCDGLSENAYRILFERMSIANLGTLRRTETALTTYFYLLIRK